MQSRFYLQLLLRKVSACLLAITATVCLADGPAVQPDDDRVTIFVSADPQINIPKWGTAGTEKMIEIMNNTPGQLWPFDGPVHEPRGLLIPGDLVDDLDNEANWKCYQQFYSPTGDALCRFPVYAGIGNHDLHSGQKEGDLNELQQEFVRRNRQRPAELNFCPQNYHYSWDWGGVHFVNLNLFPGNAPRPVYDNTAPWNDPQHSLDFLRRDLADQVGDSGRPVVLMWHYGLVGWGLDKWWTEADLAALKKVIEPYHVVLILHGHEHAYRRYQWEGYDVLMAPAPQYAPPRDDPDAQSTPKGFVVIRLGDGKLESAERTATGWRHAWSKSLEAAPASR